MAASNTDKLQLRALLRRRRRELDASEQDVASQLVARHAQQLPHWNSSKHIAAYRDTDGEVGTHYLIAAALSQGKHVYLPVIGEDRQLAFAHWAADEPLQNNRFGIAEPAPGAMRRPLDQLDIIFMPLVGWDRRGNRLGMGGGFYDRALENVSGPLLAGLAHSVQELENVASESWDVALDVVLTEAGAHECPRNVTPQPEPPISG
jgi:5-formyltetrahydrofolate cyclo-ligase